MLLAEPLRMPFEYLLHFAMYQGELPRLIEVEAFLAYSVCEFKNRKNFWAKTVISSILRHKETLLLKYIVLD